MQGKRAPVKSRQRSQEEEQVDERRVEGQEYDEDEGLDGAEEGSASALASSDQVRLLLSFDVCAAQCWDNIYSREGACKQQFVVKAFLNIRPCQRWKRASPRLARVVTEQHQQELQPNLAMACLYCATAAVVSVSSTPNHLSKQRQPVSVLTA